MAKYLIDGETLTSIADAIREKTGVIGKIDGKDMAAEIRSISASGPLTLGEDKIARFSGGLCEVNYTLWKLLENSSAENLSDTSGFAWGSECDFSLHIYTPGSYFVTCTAFGDYDSDISAQPVLGNYVSNVVTFTEKWLFEYEYIDVMREDLPAPTNDVSYTAFVDGTEIATATCIDNMVDFVNHNLPQSVYLYYSNGKWRFDDVDSQVLEGTVSIRINN